MNSLIFLQVGYWFAILLNLGSLCVVGAFVIPLLWKQANVKNGLIKLRRILLRKGFLFFIAIISTLATLTLRLVVSEGEILRYTIVILIDILSIAQLLKALLDLQIFRGHYSQESKDMHARFDKFEKLENSSIN